MPFTTKLNKDTLCFAGFALLLTLPYLFWLATGGNSYVLIHDNLDHEFVFIRQLLQDGYLFDYQATVEGVMHGIPRSFYRSGLNLTFLIFSILPPFEAYVVHHFIVHFTGFAGMWLLARRYIFPGNCMYAGILALLYALIPYYHIQYGISVAGIPLLAYAFLNFLHGKARLTDWLIVVLFPFFSFLPVTLPFFLPLLVLTGFYFYKKHGRIPRSFILAVLVITLAGMAVEWPLLREAVAPSVISHRTEMDAVRQHGLPSLQEYLFNILKHFIIIPASLYHAGRFLTLPVTLLVLLLAFKRKLTPEIKAIALLILLIVIWKESYLYFLSVLPEKFRFFRTFQFDRFYFLLPFLWLVLGALAVKRLSLRKPAALALAGITALSVMVFHTEFIKNFRLFVLEQKNPVTFNQYFDDKIFPDVKKSIERINPEGKALCLGIYPNLMHWYGIATLDSYQNNYPLAYKHEFRKIIAGELERNPGLQKYFDHWGSRCYAFNTYTGRKYMFGKTDTARIGRLDFDWPQFERMGGRFVISALPVDTAANPALTPVDTFTHPDAYWKIYLYSTGN